MLVHITKFRNDVSDARGMIADAHHKNAANTYIWHSAARTMFTESSFMKIFIAWEFFLEQTFLDYMMGTASMAGRMITRYVTPIDIAHANNLLIGNQRFADWSNPDTVRKMASLFFHNGEPYETGLATIHPDLVDLKTIRNAASHTSTTTSRALDALASRKLQTTITGCTVASLLSAADPASAAGETFLGVYCELLDGAATVIANA